MSCKKKFLPDIFVIDFLTSVVIQELKRAVRGDVWCNFSRAYFFFASQVYRSAIARVFDLDEETNSMDDEQFKTWASGLQL